MNGLKRNVDYPASETRRVMKVCNVCSFCTGLCPVFPAAESRLDLLDGDLDHLSNLCHNCRACWYACQYAPPHEFAINVPATLARQRADSYRRYAWPGFLARPLHGRPWATLLIALSLSLLPLILALCLIPAQVLFSAHIGEEAFYRVIPWGLMSAIAGLSLGFSLLSMAIGLRRFWRATATATRHATSLPVALVRTLRDILSLAHLQGGGPGCHDRSVQASPWRRRFHHALFYGFLACFAATVVAAFHHHLLDRPAPYPHLSLPSLLGTLGGLSMVLGILGLWWIKTRSDPQPQAPETLPADHALLGLLLAVAVSGLVLTVFRSTPAMGVLLNLHLGTVFAFFVLMPFGKFVHGMYRGASLLRHHLEHGSARLAREAGRSTTDA